ncbi:GNAT family N-acetyltransferase [Jongsikchunia kroppenstedtii]|uniref:GNAT family N-acetyltransferase n=1 Tax=Jongsikchunia kroppenstedtii TaxID=1121721 RepID=UPI000684B21B|nr:GNAT family N-acetyltransferase [Jongsikchunia kroppenstedtii]
MVQSLPPQADPRIRPATHDDIPAILGLIRELAIYEKAEHEAQATPAQLDTALFGDRPTVYAIVAAETPGGPVVGFALYFLNFSTWLGVNGIYLEDLYVQEDRRGTGLGKALLQTLAQIAVTRGYGRVEWSVLTWNTPSIGFYESIGARAQDEWQTMRLTGAALADFGR